MTDRDRNAPPSQSINAPRDGQDMATPDSISEKPNKPDTDVEDVSETGATRNQSQVTPDDYPKNDGGRPDYGSPERKQKDDADK